jgi:hypothetical protein
MADQQHDARARADVKAGKKQSAEREGAKARAAYDAETEALRAKTVRLKALRLAKEEADRKAGITAPTAAPLKKTAKAKAKAPAKSTGKKVAGKLSEWLDDQKKDGRPG